jgi:4-azaleucine resistance transporter AzlC
LTLVAGTQYPKQKNEFVTGCIACAPTVLGYLSIGFSAGALSRVSGMSVFEIGLMSLVLYAGSAQFIVAGMLKSNATVISIWIAIFFVNLRHLLMSAYMAPFFKNHSVLKKLVLGSQLTDETFGVASVATQEGKNISFAWMFGLNITAYLNWFLGNIIGGFAANFIPLNIIKNLQFSLLAMFIGLIVLQISSSKDKYLQLFAAIASAILFYPMFWLFGKELSVVLSAVAASFIMLGAPKWILNIKQS